jgi:hypothetical protein
MMAIPSIASPIIRLLAAIMVMASIGVVPAAAFSGPRADHAHFVQDASAHDCCEPEPTIPDENCGLTCTQASCGWTVFPAITGWAAPMDRQADRWMITAILPDDIAPETTTPPPRA